MYQISPELEDEINTIMNLQKKLLLLSTENVESSYQYIIDSTFILSFDRPHQLTSILFVAIEYRPWSIPYIAQLCHKLLEHDASINSLSKLKSEILFTIFNKERVKQENLHFLAHCLNVRFFFPQEVVDFIHQFSIDKSGFVKELLEYFAWFAPEIEMTNPSLFQKLFSLYKKQCLNNHCNTDMRRSYSDKTKGKNDNPHMKPIPTKSTRNDSTEEETEDDEEDDDSANNNNDNSSSDEEEGEDLDPELLEFFRNFDKLRENNWELLKKYRLNGCNHNRINIAIKEDDVDEVQRIVSEQNLDVNKTSRPSIFELSMFCQTDPTFIQISAFYGSVECFKYFYLNGADIQKCDEEGKTTVHFAVAGGNNEIIRLLQRANADFRGAGNIATLYHRNEIFKWIYDTIENDVTFVDKYHGTLLESSCGSNNLEVFRFCMEHGTDVNQKNERGVSSFLFFFSD